jgi:acyl-CoA synthetase (AMP-forming)/AMP-acid ligase II
VTVDELHGHLARTLDRDLRPDHVVLRERLPESVLGKVLRRQLSEELAAQLPDLAEARDGEAVAP